MIKSNPPLYSSGVAHDYHAVARDRLSAEELFPVQIVLVTLHGIFYRFGLGIVIERGGTSGVDHPRVALASGISWL